MTPSRAILITKKDGTILYYHPNVTISTNQITNLTHVFPQDDRNGFVPQPEEPATPLVDEPDPVAWIYWRYDDNNNIGTRWRTRWFSSTNRVQVQLLRRGQHLWEASSFDTGADWKDYASFKESFGQFRVVVDVFGHDVVH